MNREELLAKYAEVSVELYYRLERALAASARVEFSDGKARLTFAGEEQTLPMNGFYVLFDKCSSPKRIVRIGTHEPTNPNGLLPRLFNHFGGGKNRSILRKHIGSALLAEEPRKLAKWMLKKERGDAATECAVTAYMEEHFEAAFLPVEDLKALGPLEKYLISAVATATVNDPALSAAREGWLGNSCAEATVAEYGVWNDDHVKWRPKDEAELKKLLRTLEKYIGK